MSKKRDIEIFEKAAIIRCKEVLKIEPTPEQIEKAAYLTDEKQRLDDGLFMYGWELAQQTIRIVAEASGIPPEEYELAPERRRRKDVVR